MIPDYMPPVANHLWQSTVFTLVVWVTTVALRKNRAAVRHGLWLAASVKFLVPFTILGSVGSLLQSQTAAVTPAASIAQFVGAVSEPFSLSSSTIALPAVPSEITALPQARRLPDLFVGVWLLGVVTSLFWWYLRWRRVSRIVRLAMPANFKGPLPVVNGPENFEPGVFGILRPVLLMPEGISDRLSSAQLDAVLAHELSHVRRRDNLTMAMHMFVEALFWFHPAVWWIKLRLLDEQERACDEEVLQLGSEPMVYAESLLKVCEFYVESPLTCISGVTGFSLKERVGRIMRNETGEALSRWRKIALITLVTGALTTPIVAGMVSEPTISSRAQQPVPMSQSAQLQPPVAFEVASVRVRKIEDLDPRASGIQYLPGGRFTAKGAPLRALIQEAYDSQLINIAPEVRASNESMQILTRTPFDVEAVAGKDAVPPNAPSQVRNEKIRLMLQTLLSDRFKLVVQRENGEGPVYAIVIGSGGHKLLKAAIDETECGQRPLVRFPPDGKACHSVQADSRTGIHGEAVAISDIAKLILYRGLPIVDRTGLSGLYNVQTNGWMVEVSPPPPDATDVQKAEFADAADPSRPTLPSVFGGLGLRLEAQTAPVEVIVIRHIERPSEN